MQNEKVKSNTVDSRSDLERQWDELNEEDKNLVCQRLIKTLQDERNAWISNSKQLQKQVNETLIELRNIRDQLAEQEEKFSKMFGGGLV